MIIVLLLLLIKQNTVIKMPSIILDANRRLYADQTSLDCHFMQQVL